MALEDKVTRFNADVDLAHQIVHGSDTTTVTTEGGPVKTLAKAIKDLGTLLASAIAFIQPGSGAVSLPLNKKIEEFVSVLDFGAVADWNGTTGTNNTAAFMNALTRMLVRGGGTLLVPPGSYWFGNQTTSAAVMSIASLKGVLISAYGAKFYLTTNTVAEVTPIWLNLLNPNGVTIAGASWEDTGFSQSYWAANSRRGMGCVSLNATTACAGFRMVDCEAKNATYFLVGDFTAANQRRKMSNISVQNCRLNGLYYGVDLLYPGDCTNVQLDCVDVRRGFIAFGQRNAKVDLVLRTTAGFLGSNAFVAVVCEGNAGGYGADNNAENIDIKVKVSGVEAHENYVHIYHQQDDSAGEISNVDIDIKVNGLIATGKNPSLSLTNLVKIDHELPNGAILAATARTCKNIHISGGITGTITGLPLVIDSINLAAKPTISMSPNFTRAFQANPGTTAQAAVLRDKIEWRSPTSFKMADIIPIGSTSAGVASGWASKGYVTICNKWATLNGTASWTGHTGTGDLLLVGFPQVDTSLVTNPIVTVMSASLTKPAGSTVMGLLGGANDNRLILYEDSATAPIAVDPACSFWFSASYPIA